jgi:hypothetical protein
MTATQDSKTTELQAEIAALKVDYLRACQTVAAMHEAATGRAGEAPWLGVVEDVAALRQDACTLRNLLRNTQTFVCSNREYAGAGDLCGDIAEAMAKTAYLREPAAAIGAAK